MPRSIQPLVLSRHMDVMTVIDVRKAKAREDSGLTIAEAVQRVHNDVPDWGDEFRDKQVVVFCVHGHEVSQEACLELSRRGVDAAFLEGGFEGWRAAGLPTVSIGATAR